MMAAASLSRHDIHILEKIKDPESNPLASVIIEPSLSRDPHITNDAVYDRVAQQERDIIVAIQRLEVRLMRLSPTEIDAATEEYKALVRRLEALIEEYPQYASARNNRVQAIRRLYGDTMLLASPPSASPRLIRQAEADEVRSIAAVALADLDRSIALLKPRNQFAPISPQAAKTLSLAYTQRAAIYHATAKLLSNGRIHIRDDRPESTWDKSQFEEAAAADFAMGGRFGNEIAKGLAVSTNPTAKLCGQMVREAMKKEYGSDVSG